jgi:hypothetical protein
MDKIEMMEVRMKDYRLDPALRTDYLEEVRSFCAYQTGELKEVQSEDPCCGVP